MQVEYFVARGLKINLQVFHAPIIELNLAAKLTATTDYDSLVHDKFPTAFQGLGNLASIIQLKRDIIPYVIYSAQNTPLATSLKPEWKQKTSFSKLMS